MRNKITAIAIQEMYSRGRKEIIRLNEKSKLVGGAKLTQLELEVAYSEANVGRSDLFPERYPEMNGKIDRKKSIDYWDDLWSVVKPMIESDSPKCTKVDASAVIKELRKL